MHPLKAIERMEMEERIPSGMVTVRTLCAKSVKTFWTLRKMIVLFEARCVTARAITDIRHHIQSSTQQKLFPTIKINLMRKMLLAS